MSGGMDASVQQVGQWENQLNAEPAQLSGDVSAQKSFQVMIDTQKLTGAMSGLQGIVTNQLQTMRSFEQAIKG